MCGIAGIISKKNFQIDYNKIYELMHRRGPDQQGKFIYKHNNYQINLYASRLKIIDLNDRSNQPFEFGKLNLVYNGEIYNYLEIKNDLISKGRRFKTGL